MVSASLGSGMSTAHLDQSHHAHRVQQKWHSDAYQPNQWEDEREDPVISLGANEEKTPGAGQLDVITPNPRQG